MRNRLLRAWSSFDSVLPDGRSPVLHVVLVLAAGRSERSGRSGRCDWTAASSAFLRNTRVAAIQLPHRRRLVGKVPEQVDGELVARVGRVHLHLAHETLFVLCSHCCTPAGSGSYCSFQSLCAPSSRM